MPTEIPPAPTLQTKPAEEPLTGLMKALVDLDFLKRFYRTTLIVVLLGAALLWENKALGPKAAMGWMAGAVLCGVMYRVLELTVRRFIRPEEASASGMLLVGFGKLFGLLLVGVALAWAAKNQMLNLIWVLVGFTAPHLILILKLMGQGVVAWSRKQPDPRAGKRS